MYFLRSRAREVGWKLKETMAIGEQEFLMLFIFSDQSLTV